MSPLTPFTTAANVVMDFVILALRTKWQCLSWAGEMSQSGCARTASRPEIVRLKRLRVNTITQSILYLNICIHSNHFESECVMRKEITDCRWLWYHLPIDPSSFFLCALYRLWMDEWCSDSAGQAGHWSHIRNSSNCCKISAWWVFIISWQLKADMEARTVELKFVDFFLCAIWEFSFVVT